MIQTSAVLSLDEDIKLNSDEVCRVLLSNNYHVTLCVRLCYGVFCSVLGPNMYPLRQNLNRAVNNLLYISEWS